MRHKWNCDTLQLMEYTSFSLLCIEMDFGALWAQLRQMAIMQKMFDLINCNNLESLNASNTFVECYQGVH